MLYEPKVNVNYLFYVVSTVVEIALPQYINPIYLGALLIVSKADYLTPKTRMMLYII